MKSLSKKIFFVGGLLLLSQYANAAVTMTLTESASGITVTSVGTLNTTGLTLHVQNNQYTAISGSNSFLGSGGLTGINEVFVTVMTGFTSMIALPPSTNGVFYATDSSTGERFSMNFLLGRLQVDGIYNVGDTITINSSSTYNGLSLATIGWSTGSFGATLPNDQVNLNIVSTIPEPSSMLLGLAGSALLFRRRRF